MADGSTRPDGREHGLQPGETARRCDGEDRLESDVVHRMTTEAA